MKRLLLVIFLASNIFAFSTTNIQLLYGDFNDNSYVYDTQNGGKTTATLEHYSSFEYFDLYMFTDYAIASDKYKYKDKKTDLYGEFSPRLNLSKISSTDLSFSFVQQLYLAFQYNASDEYNAFLYGLGSDFCIYGFNVFGLNVYRKNQNIGDYTYQLSLNYDSKKIYELFHLNGFIDWTEDDFTTQNQFLFDISKPSHIDNLEAGIEWHYYRQKPSKYNFNTSVDSNTVQIMMKYSW